jgi:hypothetical protein
LLGAFSGVANQPGGPQKLVEAAKQKTGTLGRFADMLSAGGQSSLVERGSQLLTSLLGARNQIVLADSLVYDWGKISDGFDLRHVPGCTALNSWGNER